MAKTEEEAKSERYSLRKLGKRLLYVLFAVIAFFIIKAKFLTPPEVAVATVRRQDVVAEVQGTGTIAVDVLATVGAKIPGRIQRVLVDERDFVRSGQVVAQLEDTDLQRDLQRAQARLAAARSTTETARAREKAARATAQTARATEQAQRATEESKRATEWQTERAWEREKHLVATGAVSQEEADQYEEQYRTAASAVGAAEAEVQAAANAVGSMDAEVGVAASAVAAADAEVRAAEADVRLQEFTLSETKIFSYVSGVVANRPKRAGDAIVAGETVVTVADPKLSMVDAFVDQRFSGKIRAGQTATVILRGSENQPISGRVYRVSPQADPAAEEMTVEITFPLSAEDLELGQWADVYVQVGKAKDALVVPNSAIMSMAGTQLVLVVGSNSKLRQVRIEPLASSPRVPIVAVKGDLKAGDQVVVSPMAVRPGQKVRITPTSAPPAMTAGSGPGPTASGELPGALR